MELDKAELPPALQFNIPEYIAQLSTGAPALSRALLFPSPNLAPIFPTTENEKFSRNTMEGREADSGGEGGVQEGGGTVAQQWDLAMHVLKAIPDGYGSVGMVEAIRDCVRDLVLAKAQREAEINVSRLSKVHSSGIKSLTHQVTRVSVFQTTQGPKFCACVSALQSHARISDSFFFAISACMYSSTSNVRSRILN